MTVWGDFRKVKGRYPVLGMVRLLLVSLCSAQGLVLLQSGSSARAWC